MSRPTDDREPELRFSERDRVAIWYLVEEEFPPAESTMFGDDVGGEEQALLEERTRKALRTLELARGRGVQAVLRNFVISKATPTDLLVMLEEMPATRFEYLRRDHFPAHSLEQARELLARIEAVLRQAGLNYAFDGNGKLAPADLDTRPKPLADLPGREGLYDVFIALSRSGLTAVIFMDLDNFKLVNDKQGHAAGDACLERTVDAIAQALARKGVLHRYGGDEFVAVLPNFNVDEVGATAERLRAAIESANVESPVPVTASIGVAVATSEEGAEDTIARADEASYGAKSTGKNRVVRWPLTPEIAAAVSRHRDQAKGR